MLKIVTVPHPVLRKKAKAITKIDDRIRQIIQEMTETLENNPRQGVGLAAPQVNQSLRIILAKSGREEDSIIHILINPEIVSTSEQKEDSFEGCLSIPNTYCLVTRHKKIVVKALNPRGAKITVRCAGLFARILQHEIDHLEGILITDKAVGEILTEEKYNKLLDSQPTA